MNVDERKHSDLYHPDMYDASAPVPSYWEADAPVPQAGHTALDGEESCDVAIIGGGYTGLAAALHLARDHHIDARVLEAGHIGWGASGRNAGFCGLAATKLSYAQIIARYGVDEARRFVTDQRSAVELVRQLAEEEDIHHDPCGDGSIEVAHRPSRFGGLRQEAELLRATFGLDADVMRAEEFAELGYTGPEQHGAMRVRPGFALHPLKLVAGLATAAVRRGARLHPLSPVLEWTGGGGRHCLRTPHGYLHARRVLVATNGFTRDGLHPALDGRVLPAISNIGVTRTLTAEELERHRWRTPDPICNTRHLLNYFRLLPDGRLLFGARGDTTGRPASGARMRERLMRRVAEVFPQWCDVPLTHFWRGFVCVTSRLTPCIGQLEEDRSVAYALGYHANGVNTAPWAGMIAARLLAGAVEANDVVPAMMAGLAPRFPLSGWRIWALRGAYLYYRLRDAA